MRNILYIYFAICTESQCIMMCIISGAPYQYPTLSYMWYVAIQNIFRTMVAGFMFSNMSARNIKKSARAAIQPTVFYLCFKLRTNRLRNNTLLTAQSVSVLIADQIIQHVRTGSLAGVAAAVTKPCSNPSSFLQTSHILTSFTSLIIQIP